MADTNIGIKYYWYGLVTSWNEWIANANFEVTLFAVWLLATRTACLSDKYYRLLSFLFIIFRRRVCTFALCCTSLTQRHYYQTQISRVSILFKLKSTMDFQYVSSMTSTHIAPQRAWNTPLTAVVFWFSQQLEAHFIDKYIFCVSNKINVYVPFTDIGVYS